MRGRGVTPPVRPAWPHAVLPAVTLRAASHPSRFGAALVALQRVNLHIAQGIRGFKKTGASMWNAWRALIFAHEGWT